MKELIKELGLEEFFRKLKDEEIENLNPFYLIPPLLFKYAGVDMDGICNPEYTLIDVFNERIEDNCGFEYDMSYTLDGSVYVNVKDLLNFLDKLKEVDLTPREGYEKYLERKGLSEKKYRI